MRHSVPCCFRSCAADVEDGNIIGANTTEEALDALDQYRHQMYGDRPSSISVEADTLRKDYVRTSPEETAEQVKLAIVPHVIDLDGYTPVVTFGETN